jgi:CBS domain containing-hemolysin-like protein
MCQLGLVGLGNLEIVAVRLSQQRFAIIIFTSLHLVLSSLIPKRLFELFCNEIFSVVCLPDYSAHAEKFASDTVIIFQFCFDADGF